MNSGHAPKAESPRGKGADRSTFSSSFDTQERKMTQATTKLVTDLRVLAADAEELVKLTASQTGEKFAAVRDKLQRSLADAKPRLVQAQATITNNAKAAINTGEAYVQENPLAAVGVAVGVGLLIGLLIGRR
jgi:ElaB/YqjD/DUF883 family membrane-anchored ribosome-binding protein